MATIRDIAKLAGVSHGTASNVLNGRGNVSMKKILLVESAARQFGYSIDERGRMLHQEFDRSIAIVLPTLELDQYAILYSSATAYLQERGFFTMLYLTGDVPAQETNILSEIAGRRCQGVLLVTCQPEGSETRSMLLRAGTQLVCLEREASDVEAFVGFDTLELANRVDALLREKETRRLTIIGGLDNQHNEVAFIRCLTGQAEAHNTQVHTLQTEALTAKITAFTAVAAESVADAIVTTSLTYARQVLSVLTFRDERARPLIISLAPSVFLPQGDGIERICMNWKRAALQACKMVLGDQPASKRLLPPEPASEQPVYCASIPRDTELNILMMDEPATYALQNLLPDFTRATGIKVRFAIFPYGELFSMIDHMKGKSFYDVMRMDIMWLSAFCHEHLKTFNTTDDSIRSITLPMLDSLQDVCCTSPGYCCAFPFAPSVQMQFYRKDLFEDVKIKRQFYEATRSNLTIPEDYSAFEALLHFFSQAENPASPVEYGAPLVTGTPVSIVCEFLPILTAMGGSIFDEQRNPALCSQASLAALEHFLRINRLSLRVPAGQMWNGAVEAFSHSRTAMLNVFTNHARSIVNLRKSKIAGRIGYASIPGKYPLLGGGVLGVSASSKRSEAALEFIRWACSERISIPFTLLSGASPCRNVYENEDLLEVYPWLAAVPENIRRAVRRRVPSPLDDYSVENIIGRAIKNALFEISSPRETLQFAQDELLQLRRERLHEPV